MIIAFSGPGNTGKSSLINGHPEAKGIKQILEEQGKSVLVLTEIARAVYDTIGAHDMIKFQEEISKQENYRQRVIQKQKEVYDVLLVDRTYMDNIAYVNYNIINGNISGDIALKIPEGQLYDHILYFDTPIKQTTTQEFSHYNNDLLNRIMKDLVKGRFGEKVKLFSNAIDDREKINKFILNQINND